MLFKGETKRDTWEGGGGRFRRERTHNPPKRRGKGMKRAMSANARVVYECVSDKRQVDGLHGRCAGTHHLTHGLSLTSEWWVKTAGVGWGDSAKSRARSARQRRGVREMNAGGLGGKKARSLCFVCWRGVRARHVRGWIPCVFTLFLCCFCEQKKHEKQENAARKRMKMKTLCVRPCLSNVC